MATEIPRFNHYPTLSGSVKRKKVPYFNSLNNIIFILLLQYQQNQNPTQQLAVITPDNKKIIKECIFTSLRGIRKKFR